MSDYFFIALDRLRLEVHFKLLNSKGLPKNDYAYAHVGLLANFLDLLEEKGLTSGFIIFPTGSHLICSLRT